MKFRKGDRIKIKADANKVGMFPQWHHGTVLRGITNKFYKGMDMALVRLDNGNLCNYLQSRLIILENEPSQDNEIRDFIDSVANGLDLIPMVNVLLTKFPLMSRKYAILCCNRWINGTYENHPTDDSIDDYQEELDDIRRGR